MKRCANSLSEWREEQTGFLAAVTHDVCQSALHLDLEECRLDKDEDWDYPDNNNNGV